MEDNLPIRDGFTGQIVGYTDSPKTVPQPEPEENQTELWLEAREFMNVVSINGIPVLSMDENELLKRFKIFRKAQ